MQIKELKEKLFSAARRVKITRYRKYKAWGFLGKRKNIDRIAKAALVGLLCLVTLSFFFFSPKEPRNALSEALTSDAVVASPSQEVVHTEFEDVPVVAEKSLSLSDLEKGVNAGTIDLDTHTLREKETLTALLVRAKIGPVERGNVIDSLSLLFDLSTLKPDTKILIFKDKTGKFAGLSIPFKSGEMIAVIREGDDIYTPFSHEGRVETRNVRIQGTIERTFSGSAKKAGVPASLVSQITNALSGDINFDSVHAGDTFDIIFEKKVTQGGLELDSKQILYVGLKINKKETHRYAWTDKNGVTSFYDPKGQGSQQQLLKKPVKARVRVSSPYGNRRHPILLYNIFHSGVDLAAPKNSPIMAAGDGVITQLGRKGAYGKYIRIKHSSGYETAYGHMNGYRSTLKVGSRVKRGDVIGYVGSTGRSTGPHLHFEVIKGGRTAQPFSNHVLVAKQLKGFELEQFQSQCESVHPEFQRHLIGRICPVPPKKPQFAA